MTGRTAILWLACVSVGGAACMTADEPDDHMAVVSLAVADSIAAPEPFDADPRPLLPGEGEPRDYRLLLVNRLDGDAFIFASAGAARVALDTVPGADSVLVDIRLRADQIVLEAEDQAGAVVDSTSIDLVRTVLNRWEIAARGQARVTSRGVEGVLVTSVPGDYPRSH